MSHLLGRRGEEVPLAVAGLTRENRHASFSKIELRLRSHREKVVAWVIGPGGYSFHLTDPDSKGRQEIKRYIDPTDPARRPTEHIELKRILETLGVKHEMHVQDISDRNLEFARREMEASGLNPANVHYHARNVAEAFPSSEKPHVIACHNVVFYLSPQMAGETLGKLFSALRPRGLLSISKKDLKHFGRNKFKALFGKKARIEEHGESVLLVKK